MQSPLEDNTEPVVSRERVLTEKGVEYQLQLTRSNFRSAVSKWRSGCVNIEKLLSDSEDVIEIRRVRDHIQDCFETIVKVYTNLSQLCPQGIDDRLACKYENVEEENHLLSKRISDCLSDLREERSSIHSKSSSKARIRLDHSDSNNVSGAMKPPEVKVDKSSFVQDYVNTASAPPLTEPSTQQSGTGTSNANHSNVVGIPLNDLARLLTEQNQLNRVPPPEPAIFCGDPLEYPSWKCAFQSLIENRHIPAEQCMYYLKKYLGGAAKEAVEGYFLFHTDYAYTEAKALLDSRFGNPFVIAESFRNKLEKWDRIPPRDGFALRRLADFLRQCHFAMQSMNTLSEFEDCREQRKILYKLPDWLTTRWARISYEYRLTNNRIPPFQHLVSFICKEADILCDPTTMLLDKRYLSQTNRPLTSNMHSRIRKTTFSTSSSTESSQSTISKNYQICFFCKGRHHISVCDNFLSKRLEERKSYCASNRLCFACLNIGHRSKFCRQRLKCDTCSRYHPTALHGDSGGVSNKDTSEETSAKASTSHRVSTSSGNKSSMILPVWLSHISDPSHEIPTYAIIDNQSDTTFSLTKTTDSLGVKGTPVQLSLSTMFAKDKLIDSTKINGLSVRGYNGDIRIPLPTTYTRDIMPANRSHIPTPVMAKRWAHLGRISNQLTELLDCEVGLLIGYDCAKALIPRDVISPVGDGPYAERTDLGWGIVGIIDQELTEETDLIGISHRTVSYEVPGLIGEVPEHTGYISFPNRTKENILRFMELDFNERNDESSVSSEDRKFVDMMERSIHISSNGHYEMPLPFKNGDPVLPNNRVMAERRLNNLAVRFCKDTKLKDDYVKFMEDLIVKGYAEEALETGTYGHINYIPHHAVYNDKKPGKVRVVFDCQAKYRDRSINDFLLKGPDLTNTLIGVLCRFRKDRVAFMCDIEKMFYQFHVDERHRDYLRFLWWKKGDCSLDPKEFRMTVHLFGANSSPGCSNFALKQAAKDNESQFGLAASQFIRNDFYVDDGLTSVSNSEEAIDLIYKSKTLLAKCGVRLHKFVSNSTEVIKSVASNDLADGIKELDLTTDKLPVERALGILWCVEADAFQFRITLTDKPLTRRGILSTISSIYDPLGFISPLLLTGKHILQELCRLNIGWDDIIPDSLSMRWQQWRTDLLRVETLKLNRCYKPQNFDELASVELHSFSDASTFGYGQCSYLRLVDVDQRVHCSLVMGKSRVTPLRAVTIPRLELTAAVVSVNVSAFLQRELHYPHIKQYFWTDSRVVLGYINNDIRRFQMFVANRVQKIHDHSIPAEWRYVGTKNNPADIASRGSSASELPNSIWFTGPDFLKRSTLPDETENYTQINLEADNPDVRKVNTYVTIGDEAFDLGRFAFCSNWLRLKRAVARCLRYMSILVKHVKKDSNIPSGPLVVEELRHAEFSIIKLVQAETFQKEILTLQNTTEDTSSRKNIRDRKKYLQRNSTLYKLDPFIDDGGLLRVGGRISKSDLCDAEKHPLVLPRKHHVTELIIDYFHNLCEHQGRGITVSEIRSNGFWIINCPSAIAEYIFKCVKCRKFRGQCQGQKMSSLPKDRLEPSPPFTYCGVDCFGPFLIKEGRKDVKRYGALFTCMNCRAVHVETLINMTTDSFINCLRRFLSIRGPIKVLRCDNGTNFVGAKRDLKEALKELDNQKIQQFLVERNCDYFEFQMNVPYASHMGGVWERQIRSVRNILISLMDKSGSQLDDESLRTFLCEAAAIINSRPLTTDTLNDPTSLEPITPNHLLTMKSKVLLPPPGNFQQADVYSRKRWRRVQYLTNVFWSRWRVEFLQNLQIRQKWSKPSRNLKIDDVVLMKDDDLHRNQWRLARIVKADPESDGYVRKVTIRIGNADLDKSGKPIRETIYLDRPVHKLVLLLEN